MPWELGKYYTRSRRVGGRIEREYIGGALPPQHSEVLELRYCAPGALPQPLVFGTGQVVTDALAGHRGVVRSHDAKLRGDYMDLIKQRDTSGLSAREFYLSSIAPRLDSPMTPSCRSSCTKNDH